MGLCNVDSFGGDRNRIYVSAHSSGSHLGGVRADARLAGGGLAADAFKGAVLLSGMYDLEPVRRSKRSGYVKFTDDMVQALSGQRYLDGLHTPLVAGLRHRRDAEFQRQTARFPRSGAGSRQASELVVGEGYNHFELLETLASPYGCSGGWLWSRWGLAQASFRRSRLRYLISSARPLAISAPETVRRNTSSLMP